MTRAASKTVMSASAPTSIRPFVAHGRHERLQSLGHHQADLAERGHEVEHLLLANVAAQHARVGTDAARMAATIGQRHAVAADHHAGVCERRAYRHFGNHVDDHEAALLAIACKALLGEPFAGSRPLHVLEANRKALLPPGIEERGLQVGRGRGVGIHLGRDVEAPCACARRSSRADAASAADPCC